MSVTPTNFKTELRKLRIKAGLIEPIDCSVEENRKYAEMLKNGESLPEGIFQTKLEDGKPISEFYRINESDLSPEEEKQYIMLKNHRCLVTIQTCAVIVAVIMGVTFAFSLFVAL